LEPRKKLVREYTQGIKTNKFSFEKLSEFLSALRYLNKELSRIARSKPEKEFVDLRNSWKLVFKKDVDILDMADKLEDDNRVIYAETNGIAEAHFIPPDSSFDQQWALHNTGQTGGKDDADIDAPEAWDIETGVSTILIAVIDSGVDWNHPDLDANVWLNLGEDSNGNGILEGENFDDYGTDGIPSHQEPGYDPDTNPDPNQDNYNDGRGPDEDPFFVDPAADDYHLQIGSQCIDTGDPDPAYNDPDSTRNDMGTYGGPGAIVSPPP
jgi:mannitol/fructose-specific phosphotransferase system IIA component (Ntr-type)